MLFVWLTNNAGGKNLINMDNVTHMHQYTDGVDVSFVGGGYFMAQETIEKIAIIIAHAEADQRRTIRDEE